MITNVATTYSELRQGDRIWLGEEPCEVTLIDGSTYTARDPKGVAHVVVKDGSDPVYRTTRRS